MTTTHLDTTKSTVVVTGAASGIGRAVAEDLLRHGHRVVGLDLVTPHWTHANFKTFEVDLGSEVDLAEVLHAISLDYSPTGLVNNAGATRPGSADTTTLLDFDALYALHLRASLQLVQAFLPSLRRCGEGRIVNISSRASLGKENRIAYSATKAGLIGLTRTLALELGKDCITVNAVAPGPIATELFRKSNPDDSPQTRRIMDSLVVPRIGTPQDVSRAVRFFLSPDNGFVTGQILYVCGGATVGLAPV